MAIEEWVKVHELGDLTRQASDAYARNYIDPAPGNEAVSKISASVLAQMSYWYRYVVEVIVMATSAEGSAQPPQRGSVPLDELARRKGIRPVESVEEMAQDGVFDSDDELETFLEHVHASRHADLA